MGLLESLGLRRAPPVTKTAEDDRQKKSIVVGASPEEGETSIQTFNNTNITYQGDLQGFDYNAILKDKQGKILDLYKLSDYFIDADPIYRGIIKHVYVPFSLLPRWKLVGVNDKIRNEYLEYYRRIGLIKKMRSIFLQYYKYGNVFIYVMEDGNIVTLPVNECIIKSVTLNDEPLVEMKLDTLKNSFDGYGSNDDRYFKEQEFKNKLKGYPLEIGEALVKGKNTAQLNPENLFVLQDVKEDWQRYATPMIASFLPPLSKKALIGRYEDALLNLAQRSFVHVKYGDANAETDILPDKNQLQQVSRLFSKGMSGFPLVVTNHLASSEVIQSDSGFLHEWDKYKEVNDELLSAGGISGIVVTGVSSDGSTFSSAQVSMKAASARIEQMLSLMADVMTRINERVYLAATGRKGGKPPLFQFMPLTMEGRAEMQKAGLELWKAGAISSRSMLDNYGYSLEEEFAIREKEDKDGITETMMPREAGTEAPDEPGGETRGRKELPDDERNSPPEDAERSKAPKPSSPEGSMEE